MRFLGEQVIAVPGIRDGLSASVGEALDVSARVVRGLDLSCVGIGDARRVVVAVVTVLCCVAKSVSQAQQIAIGGIERGQLVPERSVSPVGLPFESNVNNVVEPSGAIVRMRFSSGS